MTAREYATEKIKEELAKEGKCFIAYRTDLDESINAIVEDYLIGQEQLNDNSHV